MKTKQIKQRAVPIETYGVSGKVGLIYIHRNCGFALQSRVNPHTHSQQEQEFRPEPNPNKSQGYDAGRVAYRNSELRFMRLNTLPADTQLNPSLNEVKRNC